MTSHKAQAAETCPRCRRTFPTPEELQTHIMLPARQICEPATQTRLLREVEEGITADVQGVLTSRRFSGRVSSWEELWRLLFPEDTHIPPPGLSLCMSYKNHGQANVRMRL